MKRLIYSFLAITVLLSACKYEEGPGISLRSKRDRVSNEWKVDEYSYTPLNGTAQDRKADYNFTNDSFYTYFTKPNPADPTLTVLDSTLSLHTYSYVFVITRTASYSLDVVDQDNNGIDPRMMAQFVAQKTRLVSKSIPDPLGMFNIGGRGEWSFVNKSSKIQFKPDNGGSNYIGDDIKAGKMAPVVFDIVMLTNDKMKLKAEDVNGGKHEYTLTAFNPDQYLK